MWVVIPRSGSYYWFANKKKDYSSDVNLWIANKKKLLVKLSQSVLFCYFCGLGGREGRGLGKRGERGEDDERTKEGLGGGEDEGRMSRGRGDDEG